MEYDDTAEPVDSLIAAVARIPVRDEGWTPPAELDEYKLVRPIGRGGMGSVWLAQDRLLDRLVAVKFIAHSEPDAQTRDRFVIEARAAARLQHLNVVTVHRYGELGGRPYLVSEFIRGDSLDKIAKPLAWERALELGLALARGLAAAHRSGIVHRDIKPGNAILTADGDVKLVDFGLARLGAVERGAAIDPVASTSALTAPGTVAGTPRYLAPEVRLGEPATPSSDVYGLGCILYELVAGNAPVFDAKDGVVPSLGERGGKLAAIVERCLARDASARFPSADELREALERIAAPAFGGELPEGNPYRGLVPYEAAHRALFFGRGAEIRAVIEKLHAEAFVLVTGDSGVGKSSLCRAGVLPNIADGAFGDGRTWTSCTLVPGQRPTAALAAQLASLIGMDETQVAARIADEPVFLARELRRALGTERGLVVYVDQLEELVTMADRVDADACAAALAQLVVRAPSLRVLATVRSDFLTRLAELPGLGGELARSLYLLRPLGIDGAREAIIGPVRAKGGTFESDALVDELVAAVTGADRIELPLLAFTLAQLWDARDPTQSITQRSLDAIGGVRGALARHADRVLEELLPGQRTAARRLLLRLVTADRTRARRSAAELAEIDRGALDALVRARLIVARGGDEPTYELAHDRLIDGWPTLAGWLSQSAEAHAAHGRLALAAAEWQRVDRRADALWGERQLAEVALLGDEDLADGERAFVAAGRRSVRRRRNAKRGIAIGTLAAVAIVYVGAKLVARADVVRGVAEKVAAADRELLVADVADGAGRVIERAAYDRFDAGDDDGGETRWAVALGRDDAAREGFGRAAAALDAALLIDAQRDDVRAQLAAVTRQRIALAERTHRPDERSELATRLALYDERAQRPAPAQLHVTVDPADATVTLDGAPLPASLAPGSYVIVAQRAGRASVRMPVMLRAGEQRTLALALPAASAVPPGFLYIPEGTFLYGSRDPEPVRMYFPAAPMHERHLPAFIVGRAEVTYRDYIAFLDDISPAERDLHRPHVEQGNTIGDNGAVELRRVGAVWQLALTPATTKATYTVRAGDHIHYAQRTRRSDQDWLDLPVSGITPEDVLAYAAWLDRTRRVPHARMCSEAEWEYVARGVDGRAYPTGDHLGAPDDANIDVTYGRQAEAFGPDAVGSHHASDSPFGAVDVVGNVWDMVLAHNGYSSRGSCFFTNSTVAAIANSQPITPGYKNVQVGARMCADL